MVNVLSMGQIYEFLLYGALISASIFFVLFGVANVVKMINQASAENVDPKVDPKVDDCRWLTVWLPILSKIALVVLEAFAYSYIMFVLIATLTVMGWFPFGV